MLPPFSPTISRTKSSSSPWWTLKVKSWPEVKSAKSFRAQRSIARFFASLEWHSILWLEYPTTLSRVFGHKIQFITIIYFIYRLLLMYSNATSVTLDFTNSFIHSKVGLILNWLGMKRSTQTYINHFKFISTSKMNFISFLFLFMQINASQSLFRGYDRRQLRRKH